MSQNQQGTKCNYREEKRRDAMVDLSINFGGLELKNPLIVASSENVRDIRQIKRAEECGAAAVILKAMGPPGSVLLNSILRIFIDAKGQAVSGIGGSKWLSYDEGIELVRAAKKETKIKIGVNIPFPTSGDYQFVVDAVKRAADNGADFIEINFKGLPLVSTATTEKTDTQRAAMQESAEGYGEYVRNYLSRVSAGTSAIKRAVNIPVIGKIDPQKTDVVASAMAMQRGGADAVDVANIMGGTIPIDIFNRGKLSIPAAKRAILTTVGAPYKPFAQGFVARTARSVNIPIMGDGGLMNWKDAVEMIMFGATTVSFCTLLLISGFEALTKIEKGMRAFMEQQGYSHIDDFKGLALDYIASEGDVGEFIPSVARIDKEKCTGCGICLKPAHCLATSMVNDKAEVDEGECIGCGTCSLICPEGAVSMIEI
jgi:dihydropyrimidine dehydrogenase (NAD+) subunit PreA